MKRYNVFLYKVEYPNYFVKVPELTKHQYELIVRKWIEGPTNDFLIEECQPFGYKIEFGDSSVVEMDLAEAVSMVARGKFPLDRFETPKVDLYLYSVRSSDTCIKIPNISPDQAYFIGRLHMSVADGNVYTIDDRPWEGLPVTFWRTVIVMTPEEWAGVV